MGRVSRAQAAQNRDKVVAAAARQLRGEGLRGLAIAELMAEAGLTHGGFYRHFASKEAMATEACTQAATQAAESWARVAESAPPEAGLAALAKHYLDGPAHTRCLVATLAGDVSREPPGSPLRGAYTEGAMALAGVLQASLPETDAAGGGEEPARRERALALLAALVGAAVLSRAVAEEGLGEEIRAAVRNLATRP
jgi:TetR/AcrR family transcriptional repressor of nem operon